MRVPKTAVDVEQLNHKHNAGDLDLSGWTDAELDETEKILWSLVGSRCGEDYRDLQEEFTDEIRSRR